MNPSAPFYSVMNPTVAKNELKMSQEEADAEKEFELAAAAAEAKQGPSPSSTSSTGPSRGRRESPRVGRLRPGQDASPRSPQRTRSPMRSRSPARATSSSAELENMAASLRKARHSTGSSGTSRSLSPKRGPRRAKSSGDIHEPAHRSLSPQRPCLSRTPSKKKGMRRQVSFGSKCYEEIPKADEEEKTSIWYDKEELKDLRKKVKKLARKGVENESEDCYRGLEPYVKQYQQRKSDDGSPTEQQQCNQILLELAEIGDSEKEKRKSEELSRMAQEFLNRFAEQGTKAAAQDEAEARAIYVESMDAEQVSKCFGATNSCTTLALGA